MWSVNRPFEQPWSEQPIEPQQVLYEFDGPLTFTSKVGFFDALIHKIGQKGEAHYFLASETNYEIVNALKAGELSVRGALNNDRYWILQTSDDLKVLKYWQCPHDQFPEHLLPMRGTPLYSYMKSSPDTLAQAQAFFAMAFSGDELRYGEAPFSLLKLLVDRSFEAVRRVLSPVFLTGAKSSTFDFPVRAVPGSLILALGEPLINPYRLRQRISDTSVAADNAAEYFNYQRENFFDEMSELVDQASKGDVRDSLAEERFSLLDNLQHIIPSDQNRIETVQFTAKKVAGVRSLIVNETSGSRMHRAFKRIERQPISENGKVEIVNSTSKYFVYRSTRGKQVSCYIPPNTFDQMVGDGLLRNGIVVRVRGVLSKRPNRDLLISTEEPKLIDDFQG